MTLKMGNCCGNKSYTITLYIIVLEDIFIPLLEILVKLLLILLMKKKRKNSGKQLRTCWVDDRGNLKKDEIPQMVLVYPWLQLT